MDFIMAVGISIGVLAGLWTAASLSFQMITFVGFLSWACFYAAGGEKKGLKDTLFGNLSGLAWGAIIVMISSAISPALGDTIGLSIAVVIGAAAMCWQAKLPHLGFIPGAFVGCATYFGTSGNIKGSIIALILGALLGYISQQGAKLMVKKEESNA